MDLTPLFDADADGVALHGSRCPDCGMAAFPARRVCAACRSRRSVPEALPARGRVRCSTRVETPPFGFDAPITVAVVQLTAGPTLFTLVTKPLPKGTPVGAQPAPVRSGAAGFLFEPIKESR